MTRLPLRRWWPRLQAKFGRYPWRPCPHCGTPFGAQEDSGTAHFPALVGTEDQWLILCPWCVAEGVGCWAHAWIGKYHIPCEFVAEDDTEGAAIPDDQWPQQDGELPDPQADVFATVAELLGPNHTAADAAFVNTLINPSQPEVEPEPTVDGITRAARRRTELLDRHADLLAAVVDGNVRGLLVEHGPRESPEGLVCHGCGPRSASIGEAPAVAVTYFVEFPCDTWTIADHLQRRDT